MIVCQNLFIGSACWIMYLGVTDWILRSARRDSVGAWTTKDSQWEDHAPHSSKDCSQPVQRTGKLYFLELYISLSSDHLSVPFPEDTCNFVLAINCGWRFLQGDTSSLADPAVVDQLVETKRGNSRMSKLWGHTTEASVHIVWIFSRCTGSFCW
jgi:hypothetical protein